jgi:hypothetical protein
MIGNGLEERLVQEAKDVVENEMGDTSPRPNPLTGKVCRI